MGARDTTKLEYLKQPHILAAVVIITVIVIGAIFTASKRIFNMGQLSKMDSFDACQKLVNEEALCHFASKQAESSKNYVLTSTLSSEQATTVTTLEAENSDRMKSLTLSGLQEVDAYVVIDATTYVKDYEDDKWAMYTDSEFEPSQSNGNFDFTSETSQDVVELRDNYEFETMEKCNDLNCYKYKVKSTDDPEAVTYVWFDDKEYKLRRIMNVTDEATTNSQVEYKEVKITAPSPTKEVTAEDLQQYLSQ